MFAVCYLVLMPKFLNLKNSIFDKTELNDQN